MTKEKTNEELSEILLVQIAKGKSQVKRAQGSQAKLYEAVKCINQIENIISCIEDDVEIKAEDL